MKKDFIFAEIDNKAPESVQLMRTIKSEYGFYGSIELSKDNLRSFKKNFDLNKNRIDLAVDYSHMSHLEAAGWIKDIELKENDTQLWIDVEWTPEAKKKIESKEYRYLSADFSMKFVDKETNEMIGDLLHGAGLTNRPFIRGMNPILSEFDGVDLNSEQMKQIRDIVLEETKPNKKENNMPLEAILKQVDKLSDEDKTKLANKLGVKKKASDEKDKKFADTQAENVRLSDENAQLKEDKKKAEKEAEFTALLSSGKAVEAQREAFMKDDLAGFAKLSEEINTDEKGSDDGANGNEPTGDETEESAGAKLSEMADKLAEKDGIDFSDAISQVVSDPANAKLAEKAGY